MSADDRQQDKRLATLERQMASVLQRLEDLERAGSPDGVVDASTVDERQQHVAEFCAMVRAKYGESKTDLIGGA